MGEPSVARGAAPLGGVAGLPWNRWQLCRGISGSFRLELVAGLLWNQWQLSCGTGGSFAVESVATLPWNTQRGPSAYVWQDYAMIRSLSR
jgi:hypothetical protein